MSRKEAAAGSSDRAARQPQSSTSGRLWASTRLRMAQDAGSLWGSQGKGPTESPSSSPPGNDHCPGS